jgi:hypothetical protein
VTEPPAIYVVKEHARREAGCLKWVIRDWVESATKRDHVRYAPKTDESPHRSEMTNGP